MTAQRVAHRLIFIGLGLAAIVKALDGDRNGMLDAALLILAAALADRIAQSSPKSVLLTISIWLFGWFRSPLAAAGVMGVALVAFRTKGDRRGDPDRVSEIVSALREMASGEPRARWAAAEALESRIDPDSHPLDADTAASLGTAVPQLLSMATDGNAVPVQRTAVMILGQLKLDSVGPVLHQVLRDEDVESHIRYEAARGLGRLGYEPAVADLVLALRDETVVDAAREALRKMNRGAPELLKELQEAAAADDSEEESGKGVLGAMAELADPAHIQPLVAKTRSSKSLERAGAAEALSAILARVEQAPGTGGHERAGERQHISQQVVDALEPLLSDRAVAVRIAAFECRAWPIERLVRGLADADATVRKTILRSMERFGEATMPFAIERLRGDTSEHVRAQAACALSHSEDPRIIDQVLPALADASPHVRSAAAKAVARVTRLVGREHDETVLKALEQLKGDPGEFVSRAAAEGIDEIQKRMPWQGDVVSLRAMSQQMKAGLK